MVKTETPLEYSASCVSVSMSSSTDVKERVADLALVFWDIMPRQLHYLHRPHSAGMSMLPFGFWAILVILVLTSDTLPTSLATWTPVSSSHYVHSLLATTCL